MKDDDYLVYNVNKISVALDKQTKAIEKLNWNLGKIASFLMGDEKTIKKIEEAQIEAKKKE